MNDIELEKQARNEYYKQYRAKNKERIKEYNQKYWRKKAESMKPIEEDKECQE